MSTKDFINQANIIPKTFRVGIISGFILYSVYGFLDYYMLPETHELAWNIRFYLVGPTLIVPFILSYQRRFHNFLGLFTTFLVSVAQLGIFLMIFNAYPQEQGHDDYYVGLILVILWAAFIFKLNYKIIIVFSSITIIVYGYFAITLQNMLLFSTNGPHFPTFFNNMLFLSSMSLLATIGAYLINDYNEKLLEEKKQIQKALEKSRESDRIKTSFLSTMSHEIRTPLNGIIGFSDILLDEPDDEDTKVAAESINRQGYQLLKVLSSILEFSELQSKADLGKIEKVGMKTFIHRNFSNFDLYKSRHDKPNAELEINFSEEIKSQYLYIQYEKLESVVNAILENAVKFGDNKPVLMYGEIIHESGLVISVRDKGIGIHDSHGDAVFENFRQVESGHNRKFDGIGMGLTMSKKIVNFMNGSIWYEQNTDRGTTFHVHIPKCLKRV
ncbi:MULTISPECIES: HAMP domain-containing sensor histidine kinase [unclassified Lentimicrobium]|uniref:sensor histidine kinase n=1 Tax=unclassified Lentimicrobium TaxID=2677434 RepID=UPI001557271A|nr:MULTISPECIES: HAMP domain-containing sensor histidine kinase [unclassified Lentimicrobium]NPD45345.1 HAMP domain-containing histidine kinase [Lentimicrobium sp. S6]NPD84356.1 HAMP domain-containing histidine kinase [Lentimicrobium sp. L6]